MSRFIAKLSGFASIRSVRYYCLMLFNSPLHIDKASRNIEQFNLKSGSRVLDVGSGDGEFLVRVAERYRIQGIGLNINPNAVENARKKANERLKSNFVVQGL